MFGRTPKTIEAKFALIENDLLEKLLQEDISMQDFAVRLAHLERIRKLRHHDKKMWDPNQVLTAVAPLFGILIIVVVEQKHVWRSAATNFVSKPR